MYKMFILLNYLNGDQVSCVYNFFHMNQTGLNDIVFTRVITAAKGTQIKSKTHTKNLSLHIFKLKK